MRLVASLRKACAVGRACMHADLEKASEPSHSSLAAAPPMSPSYSAIGASSPPPRSDILCRLVVYILAGVLVVLMLSDTSSGAALASATSTSTTAVDASASSTLSATVGAANSLQSNAPSSVAGRLSIIGSDGKLPSYNGTWPPWLLGRPLIFDVGSFNGRDTLEFLRNGARVVAVDGNPVNHERMSRAFASWVKLGQLRVVLGALDRDEAQQQAGDAAQGGSSTATATAAGSSATPSTKPFYVHKEIADWSSLDPEVSYPEPVRLLVVSSSSPPSSSSLSSTRRPRHNRRRLPRPLCFGRSAAARAVSTRPSTCLAAA